MADSQTTPDDEWNADKDDEWSGVIDAAHPIQTGDYKTYALAQRMIGNRHSKYALTDLVNWLLKVRNVEI